jgi:CheY-like chemotaxis protein
MLRVLVADDQEHMRELLVEALAADGHTVDPAEDGMAALKRLEQERYDLVVSDLQMPQVDGPTLYREIRKRKPDGAPQFIFITGEDEAPGYGRFLSETKAPVVSKPFKLKEFRQLLATLFPG